MVEKLEININEFILATPETVWAQVATEPGMQAWQSADTFDAREGGEARFYLDESIRKADPDRAHYAMHSTVLTYDPPRRLVYTWRQHIIPTGDSWPDDTIIDIRLEAEGAGTRIHVRHYGFEKLGPAGQSWRDGYARGWAQHDSLAMLKRRVEQAA